jgi:hypothetical protein
MDFARTFEDRYRSSLDKKREAWLSEGREASTFAITGLQCGWIPSVLYALLLTGCALFCFFPFRLHARWWHRQKPRRLLCFT